MSRHRGLTLAPQPWPSPGSGERSSGPSGSRFSWLGSNESSEREDGSLSIAHDVALRVLVEEVLETPVTLQPLKSKEDLVQDF
jgi:hypothetical protein